MNRIIKGLFFFLVSSLGIAFVLRMIPDSFFCFSNNLTDNALYNIFINWIVSSFILLMLVWAVYFFLAFAWASIELVILGVREVCKKKD